MAQPQKAGNFTAPRTAEMSQHSLRLPPSNKSKIGITGSSTLTHDVRNPLTNIALAVDILKRMITDKEQNVFLEIITRATMRINGLVNELVREQIAEELKIEDDSIQHLLDEVLVMAEDRIVLKNVLIRKYYSIEDLKKVVNRQEMKIALNNIIINAIDAMEPGLGKLTLTTISSDKNYIVEIEDNGCGISQEDLKNIFTPFFTKKTSGLGIGLSASADIFKKNSVTVHVESKETEGTRFILTFNNG